MKAVFGKILAVAGLFLAMVGSAQAQSTCPYIQYGAVLTAAQWQYCFQQKQDVLGYSPVNKAGDTMTGRLTTAASTTLGAGLNLPQGTAPTSPNNGDIWTTSSGLFVRIAGSTVGPLGTGGGGGGGVSSITAGTGLSGGTITTSGTIALAGIANNTIMGNIAGPGVAPIGLTATQTTALLNGCTGDAGSGGLKGLVPAQVTGDATKFFRGDCTFASVPGATTQATNTLYGNVSGITALPTVVTATQATAVINAFVGDTGTGGTKGSVIAPATGDATKFLRGDAAWASIPSVSTQATNTLFGNVSGITQTPGVLTATQATTVLNPCTGDSGSGGLKGLVPAQVTGDAVKFLRGDCSFQSVPSGSTLNGQSGSLTFAANSGITNTSTIFTTVLTQAGTGGVSQTLVQFAAQYGLTPQGYGASIGSDLNTTGSISSSSPTLTLANARDFVNGTKVRVNHAGVANNVNLPSSMTVTATGGTGATAWQYQILCFGNSGQYSAPITAVSISNGVATLTPSQYNALAWSAPSGTFSGCAVYGNKSGLLTLRALVPTGVNGWNDYGDTTAFTVPDWLPSTPPAGAAASWLISTVNSGGGTTTLTLANNATTTATSQSVYHDDTDAMLTWLTNCQALAKQCYLPAGVFRISNALTVAGGSATIGTPSWSLIGAAPGTSILLYAGSNISNDILTIGTGSPGYYLTLANFTLTSQTSMGAGYAMHLVNQNFHLIDGVNFGKTFIAGAHSTLYHAVYNDGGFYAQWLNSFQIAQNACSVIAGVSGMYLNNIHQAECLGIGTWIGGGSGGVYLGYGEVFGPGTGVVVDNALNSSTNYQIFHSIHWIVDSCGIHDAIHAGNCVFLNDSHTNSLLAYIMQGWASSSYSTTGANFVINSWPTGTVSFTGAQIWASKNDGIKVVDATTKVQIDGSTIITGNAGFGVNATSATNNIYSDARPYSNTLGAYASNAHVELFANPGYRKRADGYIDVFGTVTGSGSDQTITFPTGACPNNLISIQGNIISSGASSTQFEGLIFNAQSTSGFTGKARAVLNGGSVGPSSSNYSWRAFCN